MKFTAIAIVPAAALALAGCGHKETAAVDNGTMAVPMNEGNDMMAAPAASAGQTFANAAAASDAFEIASSRLALTSSSSAAVKRFAQTMITAHTGSTAKLKTAAGGAAPAITPDPTLTADQQTALAGLQGKTGKTFDEAYIAAQTDGHQKTLDTLRAYAATGDVPALKSFATTMSPIVAAHLNMAKALKS